MTIHDTNDEYFPRGGKGGEIKKKRNFVFEKKSLIGEKVKKPGRRERKRKAVKSDFNDDSDYEIVFERFEPLVYKGLSEGTLALCSVREVHEKYADISMPGRLSARLYIENVSEPYYNAVKQKTIVPDAEEESASPLSSMFRIGQHINCSVLSVKNDSHYIVRVTSDPAHVNAHMTFDHVKTGTIIQMAVQSVEDHGYMMFSGISGLVSFLPKTNTTSFVNDCCNFKPLAVGQIVWCCVTKSKLSGTSNTVQVTLDFESIGNSKLMEDISIPLLNPGVQVDVTINKIISQNLLVTIHGTNIQGYIEESQLGSMWSKPEDYPIGSVHTAVVLYKFPYARIVALTFKSNPTTISKEEIKHGAIFENAEVMSIMKRGVCMKLVHNGKTYKGMISVRRLGDNVDYIKLSTQFPLGNHMKCRVIGFDALEQVYSCSVDDKLLNEKFLSHSDMEVGQLVDVTVESFKKTGAEVAVGAVRGYVPALHICDVVIQNPLEKLTLKSKHKAKVLRIEENNIIFTLRPTLVKNRSLTSFHKVEVGDSYYGCVNKILPSAITVSFFGGLFAHIKEENLLEHPHKYTVGELVKCYVIETRFGKTPTFSLLKSVQNMALTVGEMYNLVVKGFAKNGLTCFFMSKGQQFNGFIPLTHLSDFTEFCAEERKKYPHGSMINNALLMSINEKLPLFTLKQSVIDFFEEYPDMKQGFQSLKKKMLIPCTVSEILLDRLLVCAPIPGFNGKVPIMSENLLKSTKKHTPYQELVTSVSEVLQSAREVVLTCHLEEEQKREWSVNNLKRFLKYVRPLQKFSLGDRVECRVISAKEKSLNVSIKNNDIKGVIRMNTPHNFKPGDDVEGIVIYHDVSSKYLHICIGNPETSISKPSKSFKNKLFNGTVLHVNNFFITAVLDKPEEEASRNIVLLPMASNPNNPEEMLTVKDVPLFSSCNINLVSPINQTEENSNPFWIGITNDFVKKVEVKKRKASGSSFSESLITGSENDITAAVGEESPDKKKKKKVKANIEVVETNELLDDLAGKEKKKDKSKVMDTEVLKNNKKAKAINQEGESLIKTDENSFDIQDNDINLDVSQGEISSAMENSEVSVDKKKKKKKKNKNKKKGLDVDNNVKTSIPMDSDIKSIGTNADESKLNKDTNKSNKDNKVSNSQKSSLHNDKKSSENKRKNRKKSILEVTPTKAENKKRKIEKASSNEMSVSLDDIGDFDWGVSLSGLAKVSSTADEEDEQSQDSEGETAPAKKMTPAEKRAAAFEAEKRIREKEEELLIAESNPQSAEHFDRLLTANPNSSKLWIMYMAYHMQATEIEKARSVAKRALKHINVRLEDERLNIWIASLNLENIYGTPDSFKEVLNEALKYNDDYKVYKNILTIYADSNKITELEGLVNQMIKKYKTKMECWIECQTVLMKVGLYDKARNYLQRSMEALPTKDYCTLVSRFALLENKHGFHDQAHSLFENLLTSYPKRVDLWSVYVDMLSKAGTPDLARNVLERATSQKLPLRKMKALYQKWIKFEEAYGTPEKVQEVKNAVIAYANNIESSLKNLT